MKSQSILRLCYSAARQQPALCTTYQVTTKKNNDISSLGFFLYYLVTSMD